LTAGLGNRTVLILAMGVGAFIPPIGVGFYVSAAVASAELEPAAKAMIPYAIVLILAVLLIALVPELVLQHLSEAHGQGVARSGS
jgi:TRAP-type C4-dicarboxylate transport system permease large subunit